MKNVQVKRLFLLSYHHLYEDNIDPAEFLKNVPRNSALEFISYILHLYNLRKRDDIRFQSQHLIQWMFKMEPAAKNHIFTFIQQQSGLVFDPSFKLIDRRPCLDLIQHILVYSRPDTLPLRQSDYSNLFLCLLYFNEVENRAQEQLFNWDGSGSIEEFANSILTVQVRNIEHERFKNYVLQFLKVYYFFVFCESHAKYSTYLNLFLSSLSLSSYRKYLIKIISPFLRLIVNEPPTPKMHMDNNVAMHFYNRLIINEKISSTHKDYKPIRQYPLFEIERHTYIFMDFRFFVDKFYQGFLFDFATITEIAYDKLKTDLGNEFSEHVLFYTAMKKCFANYGSIRLTGKEIKTKISNGEPDYYLRSGLEIFAFEFKDLTIAADIKYSGNSETIKKCIAEKLERSSHGKRKGITQLLHTIKDIDIGLYREKGVDMIDAQGIVVYPIVVHTDIALESCGVNYFLDKRMSELIGELALSKVSVKNLLVINIDTLIQLQDHFANGKLNLSDCINSYFSYTSADESQTATFPFDEFIKYYFVEKTKETIGNPKDFDDILASFAEDTQN